MPAGLKRYYGKGDLHFITFSCYRRLPLLKTTRARNLFVNELGRVRDATGFRLIGYVVMPGHMHLLSSEPREGTPSTVPHKLKLGVARKLRKRKRGSAVPTPNLGHPPRFSVTGKLCSRGFRSTAQDAQSGGLSGPPAPGEVMGPAGVDFLTAIANGGKNTGR